MSLIEVPITSNMITLTTERRFKEGKITIQRLTVTFRRLVVARRPDGHTDMFVITVLPSSQKDQKMGDNVKNFRYLGGADFSGRVFCSTLDGRFVEAWNYSNGNRTPLRVTTRKQLAQQENHWEEDEYLSIRFTEAIMTRAGTYNTSNETEGGDSKCELHNRLKCPDCLDEVFVKICRYCKNNLEQGQTCNCRCGRCKQDPCQCCTGCGFYPCKCVSDCPLCRPFVCKKCTLCGNHFCYGTCEKRCPYNKCSDNPCSCCSLCYGQCKCSGCHQYPCMCCEGERCPICYKPIRTLSRSLICNSHEHCPTNGACVKVKLSISSPKTLFTLGEEYKIELDLTPANTICYDITYYIIKNGQKITFTKEGLPLSLTVMARSPGNYQLQAEVMQDGSYINFYSNTVEVTHQFPHRNEILNQQVVIDGINSSWAATLANADALGMQEFGGVVNINTREDHTGPLYRYISAQGNKTPYTASSFSVQLPTNEVDRGPVQGGDFAVLLFHTHPPFWGYNGNTRFERRVGPSDLDLKNHTTIPAIVKDFQHATDTIHSLMRQSEYINTEKLYHYGIDRKIN